MFCILRSTKGSTVCRKCALIGARVCDGAFGMYLRAQTAAMVRADALFFFFATVVKQRHSSSATAAAAVQQQCSIVQQQ